KAANEMKDRVAKLVGPVRYQMLISTFHSMCVRILRRDIGQTGYSRNFTILDVSYQQTVSHQVLKNLNIDPINFELRANMAQINNLKNKLVTPKEYTKAANNYYEKEVAKIYEAYQKMLQKNEALDFDDLIMQTIHLFERVPETLE